MSAEPSSLPTAPPALVAEDLVCLRGDRVVFSGLEFALDRGAAMLLVGPNGSGKSSLLRLLALLLRPWRGALYWDGRPVAAEPDQHRLRLRYVGHQDAIKPVLTPLEMLAFWAGLDGLPAPVDRARRALETFALGGLAAVPGRFLSAGQKRRVNLARLLLAPAPLWLLDEPTTGLDRESVARLEQCLEDHRAHGGLVLLSTHIPLHLPGHRTLALDAFSPEGMRNEAAA